MLSVDLLIRDVLGAGPRRACAVVVLAASFVAGVGCDGGGDDDRETAPPKRACQPGPPYGKGNWPPAPCWRPYHDESPFNDPVGTVVREYPNSAAMIQRLLADTSKHPGNLVVRVDGHTGEPTYYAQGSDPEYTLKCTMVRWGDCPFGTDTKIHIPRGAVVEGNTPAQITNSEACEDSEMGSDAGDFSVVLPGEFDSEFDTEMLPADPVVRGEAPTCDACGRFIGMLGWRPPHRADLTLHDDHGETSPSAALAPRQLPGGRAR